MLFTCRTQWVMIMMIVIMVYYIFQKLRGSSSVGNPKLAFSTIVYAIKRVVLFGALKVLRKDNVSTNYVADCRHKINSIMYQCHQREMTNVW